MTDMNNPMIPLIKIESMSSLEIAELTGKQVKHVHRDIKNQLFKGLYDINLDGPDLDHVEIRGKL